MNLVKSLAYAVFMLFLCIAPIFADAQDNNARLIDIPDVDNDVSGNSFTNALREIFAEDGHIVFNEEEMNDAAAQTGVKPEYWTDPELIKRVNQTARHDALIYFVHHKSSKKSKLVFSIYNAYTGELMQDFEIRLAKKNKISRTEKKKIKNAVESIIADIDPSLYPSDVVVKIISTPSGAEVSRDGIVIGTTPLEYTIPHADTEALEQWVLTYPGRDPVIQNISVARGATYNVNIPDINQASQTGFIGKIKSGFGRPILKAGFNASPTIRRLKSEDNEGASVITYRSVVYPTFSFDLEFYPASLFSDIDYLQGLGLQASVGFGFVDTSLQINNNDTKCTIVDSSANGLYTIKCGTQYVRATVDVVYKLLLQKSSDGKLNPNGMALDFLLGYAYSGYTLDENNLYRGNVYHSLRLGARYSTPLGLDAFRLGVKFNLDITTNNGGVKYLELWGNGIGSRIGLNTGLDFSYDIYKGFFARIGYDLSFYSVQYKGNGCLDTNCTSPVKPNSKDFYHEIVLGLGYALY